MKYSTILFASTVAAAALPMSGSTPEEAGDLVVKRGRDYSALLSHPATGIPMSAFQEEFGGSYPWGSTATLNAAYNVGQPYAAVYTPGSVLFTQADADAIKCLVNLHVVQKDNCISVARSSCDNGYVLAGGRFQNVAIDGGVSGQQRRLGGEDSVAIQGAVQSLVGQKIRTDGTNVPSFYALNSLEWAGAYSIGQDSC